MLGTKGYRDKQEIERWKSLCPIARYKQKLVETGAATQTEVDELEKSAQAAVDQAVAFAQKSPLPKPEDALQGVFA